MKKYFVKLIMSEKYVIEARTKEDAEKQVREKFGCDYYIDDVKVSEIKNAINED